jgi:hypothetical protein
VTTCNSNFIRLYDLANFGLISVPWSFTSHKSLIHGDAKENASGI